MIELLVVIAIIAILAGLALPVISKVKESGNSTRCISNLRQIGAALNLYCAENNNYYPPITKVTGGGNQDWTSYAIANYLPDRTTGAATQANMVFVCPSAKYTGFATSALTRTYTGTDCMAGPASANYSPQVANTPSALNSFTGNLLLVDGCQSGATSSSNLYATWPQVSGGADLRSTGTSTYIDYRHRNACNGLYADGHVDSIKRVEAATRITQPVWRMSNQMQ